MFRTLRGPLGWALTAVVLIAACGGTAGPAGSASGSPADAQKTPRIGSFDRPITFAFTPSQDIARVTASGNAMASALGQATGLKWRVTVPTSYAAEIESVCAGQTDIATIAPLQMTLLLEKQCGTPVLSALRKDDKGQLSTSYQSQIIVRADSGITDINGLKGLDFAFTDPISTSGYLFPTLLVKEKTKQDPKTFFKKTIFAGGHDKAVLAVYNGQVAGAASFIDARTLKGMPADIMEKTKRIETAGPIPNDGIAVRKDFPADLQTQITKALIDYCASDAGKKVCKDLFSWDGLQTVDKNFYDPVKDAAKLAGIDVAAEAAKTPTPPQPTPSPSKAP
ncbi:MAG TPA: phosphate/phosphite/phosphonate ABC transporter substrate-binding protein [Candidatus Limnocylindria bacterium]